MEQNDVKDLVIDIAGMKDMAERTAKFLQPLYRFVEAMPAMAVRLEPLSNLDVILANIEGDIQTVRDAAEKEKASLEEDVSRLTTEKEQATLAYRDMSEQLAEVKTQLASARQEFNHEADHMNVELEQVRIKTEDAIKTLQEKHEATVKTLLGEEKDIEARITKAKERLDKLLANHLEALNALR